MHHVKRYANRKLYDTTEKRYVTLEDIHQLVQRGEEVEVTDNESGEDITNVTLSQIIYERQKKKDGQLPRSVFHNLIQSSGATLFDSLQKLFQGGIEMATSTQDQAEKLLRRFVTSGQISAEEQSRLLDDIRERADKTRKWLSDKIDERVEAVLGRLGVVTHTELRELVNVLEEVRGKLKRIEQSLDGDAEDDEAPSSD